MKETLIMYRDWWEAIKSLPNEQMQLGAFQAICKYAFEGSEPDDPILSAITALMRSAIDRDKTKWEGVREKRREAGRRGAIKTNSIRWGNNEGGSAKSANADTCQQMSAKSAVNDNVNVNVINNINNNIESVETTDSAEAAAEVAVDFLSLKKFINDTLDKHASIIPRVRSIDENRRKLIIARVREHGKEALMSVIVKAASSNFLNGDSSRGFRADFGWILRPQNFLKILEGNYDNISRKQSHATNQINRSAADSTPESRSAQFAEHIIEKLNTPHSEPDVENFY